MYKKRYKRILNENKIKIMSLFTKDYLKIKNGYYIREIQRILNFKSPRTSEIYLKELENEGVLNSKNIGKTKIFFLKEFKENQIIKEYLVLSEKYKFWCFLDKHNLLLNKIIDELKKVSEGIVLIFGSYAKNKETKKSDLDVFIIGKYNKKGIEIISKKYGIHLDIFSTTKNQFKKLSKKDLLISECITNHIVIKNTEEFIELIGDLYEQSF